MDLVEHNLQKRAVIEDALLQLMQETDYSRITVTDLAQHVGISRKSFYHYFQDKDACLLSLISRTMTENALYIAELLPDTESYLSFYKTALLCWKEKKDFLLAIIRSNLYHTFLYQTVKYICQEHKGVLKQLRTPLDDLEEGYEEVLFYASGYLSVLCNWALNGFETDVEVLARKMLRLAHMPLFPLESRE